MAQNNETQQSEDRSLLSKIFGDRSANSRDGVAALAIIGGIVGIPFTGGASLAMTAAGMGYLGVQSYQNDGIVKSAANGIRNLFSGSDTPTPNEAQVQTTTNVTSTNVTSNQTGDLETLAVQTANDSLDTTAQNSTSPTDDTVNEEQQRRQQAARIAEAAAAEARRRAAAQQQAADVATDASNPDGDATPGSLDPDAVAAMRSRVEGPQIEASGNQDIIQAFKNSVTEANQRKVTADGKLQFPSKEDAKNFFQKQANEGKAFEMADPAKDFYVFSNGEKDENGKAIFFSGTKAELDAFKESLNAEEAQQDATADQSNVQQSNAATTSATLSDDELEVMTTTTPNNQSPTQQN